MFGLAEGLAQALCGRGQILGDLGMHAQGLVDLPKAFGRGLTELLHQRRQSGDVGMYPRLYVTQALVDLDLAAGERCVGGLGLSGELLAIEHSGLSEGGMHELITLAGRVLVGGCNGELDRLAARAASPLRWAVLRCAHHEPAEQVAR